MYLHRWRPHCAHRLPSFAQSSSKKTMLTCFPPFLFALFAGRAKIWWSFHTVLRQPTDQGEQVELSFTEGDFIQDVVPVATCVFEYLKYWKHNEGAQLSSSMKIAFADCYILLTSRSCNLAKGAVRKGRTARVVATKHGYFLSRMVSVLFIHSYSQSSSVKIACSLSDTSATCWSCA